MSITPPILCYDQVAQQIGIKRKKDEKNSNCYYLQSLRVTVASSDMDSSFFSTKSPVFTGINYGIWAMKMATYLRAFDLWEIVESNRQPTPFNNNPTISQIKFFNEEKIKGFKALTCIHNAVSEEIFTRIMACETAKEAWDKLKAEFQGDEKSRRMQILNLKRQFEGVKMRETGTIKDFSSKISKLVNQMRLLGEDVQNSRIIEKVFVSLPEKFENKIYSLEDSRDFAEMILQDLIMHYKL